MAQTLLLLVIAGLFLCSCASKSNYDATQPCVFNNTPLSVTGEDAEVDVLCRNEYVNKRDHFDLRGHFESGDINIDIDEEYNMTLANGIASQKVYLGRHPELFAFPDTSDAIANFHATKECQASIASIISKIPEVLVQSKDQLSAASIAESILKQNGLRLRGSLPAYPDVVINANLTDQGRRKLIMMQSRH